MLIAESIAAIALTTAALSPNCSDLFSDNTLERWHQWSETREWRTSEKEIDLSRTASGHALLGFYILTGLSSDYRVYATTDLEPSYIIEDGGGAMSFSLNHADEPQELSCFFPEPGILYISRPVGASGELNIAIIGMSDFDRAMDLAKKLHLLPAVSEVCAMSLGSRHAKLKSEEFGVYTVSYGQWAASDARIFPGGELAILHEVDSKLELIEGKIRSCED